MGAYEEIKRCYSELCKIITEHTANTEESDITNFILSAAFRIWGANGRYSQSYQVAVNALTGKTYPPKQISTALACCADKKRSISVPYFLKEIIDRGGEEKSKLCETAINSLNELLYALASVNDDFTKEEDDELSGIIIGFINYCEKNDLNINVDNLHHDVTEKNEESYLAAGISLYDGQEKTDYSQDTATGGLLSKTEPININVQIHMQDETDMDLDTGEFVENSSGAHDKNDDTTGDKASNEGDSLDKLLEELDSLVGLDTVKADVHSLINFIKVSKIREERGMKVPTISYHLVFTGNPGTGKTTVARLVGKLYYHIGILPQGQLIETDRSALVAGYLGQTAIKTQNVIQKALGGVLFIDEAYSLAGDTDDSFGREAIETILKAMEDHRDELVVIVAGYDELMHKFIDSNPGLASRFNKYFRFPDYCGDELNKIFYRFCGSNGYKVSEEAKAYLNKSFADMYEAREEHFGNARTVRNIFEKAINNQANRISSISSLSDADLETLELSDIETAIKGA